MRPGPPSASGGALSGALGGVLVTLGLEALGKLGGVAVDAIADAAAGGRERRMAKRCPMCGERRDKHEGYRLSTAKKSRGYVDGISCEELRDGKAHEATILPEQWADECPVCGERRDMHAWGRMPGDVFMDGFGIIDCGKVALPKG